MNIVQEEERRVAGRAPKVAKPRRKGAHSIPRWAYVVFAVLAVLVLLRSFQQGIGTSGTAQAPVRPVTVAKVVAKDVPLYLDEIGTCAAYETVQVQAQINGVIIGRHFQDGSDVKKGDLLFTIDPRPFQAALDQAKAQAELDQVTLKRQEDLRARKVISQQDYDTAVVKARGVTPNPDRALWPSEFVRVRFILDMLKNAALVPAQAVQVSQSGPFVFVVKPDNTVDLRPVKPGQSQEGDLTVVESGVKPGETVVVTGQLALAPGAKVAPQPRVAQTPGNSQESAASKSSM